jgi:RNA polymerase sigma-70 factor (ECF subfamily)
MAETAAVSPSTTAETLVNRSSVGTQGVRQLAGRAHPDDVTRVLDRSARTRPRTEQTTSDVRDYRTPESMPRPGGRLTKEDLDPLVKDAGEGNPAAIHSLLQMIEPVVVRYCRARMGGRDLSYLSADDVAQEVCLAVLKALPDYQDRGGSFLYLVHAIAANKVADAYRAVARDRSEPVPELPERPLLSGNEPESHALQQHLGARLGRLLASLPRVQQEILTLRIAVGFSATETAEALGISAGNVRVTQHRALTRLRGMIREEEF